MNKIWLKTSIPGPASLALAKSLAHYECPEVTYLSPEFPVFWQRAEGTSIWDVDGNRFLDCNAAFGVMGLGYANPKITSAITAQAALLTHGMGDVHPPAKKVEFLKKLVEFLPAGFDQGILSCNGSDACESALKTALIATGRSEVICFEGAYHGLGFGALDITDRPLFRKPFEERLTAKSYFVPFPTTPNQGKAVLEKIKKRIVTSTTGIAAVFFEPIQGRAGVRAIDRDFLRALRDLCAQKKILLIADEIYTGLFRTGLKLACEHYDVMPDLLCLGKLLGGGLPLSACLGSRELMGSWGKSGGEAIHTSTFLGNPTACAAGSAVLDLLAGSDWASVVQARGEFLREALLRVLPADSFSEIRGRGLMIGVVLKASERRDRVVVECLKRGLIVLKAGAGGEVLSLSPPYTISEEDLGVAADIIASSLA